MAKIVDMIAIVLALVGWMAMAVYKLILMHRYRNDPRKLDSVVWSDQVFPKRLKKFIFDEHDGAEKIAPHNQHH